MKISEKKIIKQETVPRKEIPSHEECPACKNFTLPPIKKDSTATGRMCAFCKAIVDREGKVETGNEKKESTMDLLDYCIKYATTILVRVGNKNMPLSEIPFSMAIDFIEFWKKDGKLPHRVVK